MLGEMKVGENIAPQPVMGDRGKFRLFYLSDACLLKRRRRRETETDRDRQTEGEREREGVKERRREGKE